MQGQPLRYSFAGSSRLNAVALAGSFLAWLLRGTLIFPPKRRSTLRTPPSLRLLWVRFLIHLRVPRLPKLPSFQPFDKFVSHCASHRRHPPSFPLTFQQPGHPLSHHLVAVGKHRLPGDSGHWHDLRHRHFMLRYHPHHQQALARPILLRLLPCRLNLFHNRFS